MDATGHQPPRSRSAVAQRHDERASRSSRRRWRASPSATTSLNAFTAVTPSARCAKARAIDDAARARASRSGRWPACRSRSRTCSTSQGLPTLAGSKINRDLPPATRDATLIERLEAAGAVLVGALNMGEYAYDFTGENVHDGPSRNPHDTEPHDRRLVGRLGRRGRRRAGAARARLRHQRLDPRAVVVLRHVRPQADLRPAVARAHVSVRRRASIISGRSRASTRDLALAYDAMQGHDPDDPVCADRPVEPALPALERGTDGLRIAVAGGYFQQRRVSRRRCDAVDTRRQGARRHARDRDSRGRSARAPPPTSSPRPRARRCISTGCARAPATSIRPCATG